MSATVSVTVEGIAETLQTLNKLDRELRKQFNRDVKEIVRPLVDNANRNIPNMPLSQMARPWAVKLVGGQPSGRIIPPWNAAKAKKGITFKIDTRKSKQSAISVISKDAWAAIYDDAGKLTDNLFARNLTTAHGSSPRVLWRGVGRLRGPVIDELTKRVQEAERTVQAELRRR